MTPLADLLNLLLNIVFVALGLGFVIFLHELGHFLVAKWNNVKVERFSIGFGPALLRFQGRETQYVVAAFPLGGYVKMLGESPEEADEAADDPRAYLRKPVRARMAIIAAGPAMNLVLGLACFVWAYGMGGLSVTPAKLGLVVAGLPAYRAGIHTGDEVVAIDGRPNATFDDLLRSVALSGARQVVHLELKRPGQREPVAVNVEPRREAKAERPLIGVNPADSLELDKLRPYYPPPGLAGRSKSVLEAVKGGDRIVQVVPPGKPAQDVADMTEIHRVLARYADTPLQFVLERKIAAKGKTEPSRERITVALPEVHFLDLGFRLKIEPITAVQGGSIAEKAGFQPGDLIVKIDGQDDFDPMHLPTYCYQHAGKPVSFEIERTATSGAREKLTLTVEPDDTPPWCEEVLSIEPLEVPGVGLAYPVGTQIVSVREGSPAALAGLKAGMKIRGMTVYVSLPKKARVLPLDFVFEGPEKDAGWPYAFYRLQAPQQFPLPAGAHVERTVELQLDGNVRVALVPQADPSWYMPLRGFRFDYLKSKRAPMPLPAAVTRGAHETVEEIAGIYYMLRGLRQGQLSQKNFAGPVRIASMAYYFVTAGLAPFLFFLGMLSVNLAVLNFLPIPPLDGGQMAFLLAEGVRGRPLPETAQAAGTWAGLLLVVCLMLLFLYQDILSYF